MEIVARILWISALVFVAAAAASGGTVQRHASLSLAAVQPLTVRGVAFKPGERVLVQLAISGLTSSRHVLVSGSGTFKTRFAPGLGRCEHFTVRAFGSRGSRATLLSGVQLDCEPDR